MSYAAAAHEGDDEGFQPSCGADDPDETDEQDHPEDVLDAREIDSEHSPELTSTTKRHSVFACLFINTQTTTTLFVIRCLTRLHQRHLKVKQVLKPYSDVSIKRDLMGENLYRLCELFKI